LWLLLPMKYCIPIISLCLLLCSCNQLTKRLPGFAVHGIDVSHHQVEVDWDTVAMQQIDFAFIKATEGRDFKDNCFTQNWQELKRVNIKRGAWLDLIETHYKIRPIIYTNQKLYFKYLLNNFKDYPIWMARYNTIEPNMLSQREWVFWQYGNKGQVKGVEGLVDLNVFKGNLIDLENMSLSPETAISNIMVGN